MTRLGIQSPLGQLLMCFIAFCALDTALTWLLFLPEKAYTHRMLFVQPLLHARGVYVVLAVISFLGLLWLRRRHGINTGWDFVGDGRAIRLLMIVVALVLAWEFSTYAYNGYLGQSHWIDRVLLMGCAGLMAWRPGYVLAYLMVLYPLMNQLDYPLGNYLRATDDLLVHLLVLLGAYWLIAPWQRVRNGQTLVMMIGCLIAANYWWPGFGKLRLGWITHGHLHNLLPNAYAHGWLSAWSPDRVVETAQLLSWMDWPLRVATLMVECGAVLALWHRRIFIGLLLGWMGMHVGIFMLMGFCFWKWIVVDAVWVLILMRCRGSEAFRQPPVGVRVATVGLIATGGLWCEPPGLAWFDTPVSDRIEFVATGTSGQPVVLSSRYFGPYHDQFTMNDFGFAMTGRQLVHPYGVTQDRAIADALTQVRTTDELLALEDNMGGVRWNAQRSAALDELVVRIVRDANARRKGGEAFRPWFGWLRPPALFVSTRGDDHISEREDIKEVTLVRVTTWYDGERIHTFRRKPIQTLRIE